MKLKLKRFIPMKFKFKKFVKSLHWFDWIIIGINIHAIFNGGNQPNWIANGAILLMYLFIHDLHNQKRELQETIILQGNIISKI